MHKLQIANTFFEWELETQPNLSLREAILQHSIFLQLQFLPVLYADPEDFLLLSDISPSEFWSFLGLHGVSQPRIFTLEDKEFPPDLEIESWGPSQLITAWAETRSLKYDIPDWKIIKEINSKGFSFEQTPKLSGASLLTNEAQAKQWFQSFQGPKVLKTCFGVSGKGHLIIENDSLPWERIASFLHGEWKKNLPVIAEPWVKRILDFSTQWHIDKNGQISYLGSTICQNDERGKYRYNEIGEERSLFQHYFPYLIEHRGKIELLLAAIVKKGFFGNIGIDAMLFMHLEDPETIFLHPVVEINARKTMGWAALSFQKNYFPGKKIRFSYVKSEKGYLPNFLVLKNGRKVNFPRNLTIDIFNDPQVYQK